MDREHQCKANANAILAHLLPGLPTELLYPHDVYHWIYVLLEHDRHVLLLIAPYDGSISTRRMASKLWLVLPAYLRPTCNLPTTHIWNYPPTTCLRPILELPP